MKTKAISRVVCRWDDQPGVVPGWYCESYCGESMVDDSQKVWFPVAVDDFGADDSAALAEALHREYPGAEIVILLDD